MRGIAADAADVGGAFSQQQQAFHLEQVVSHESRTSVHIHSCVDPQHHHTNNDSAHPKGAIQAGSVDRLRLIKAGSGTQRLHQSRADIKAIAAPVAHFLAGRHHRNCWPGSAATARPTWSRPRSSKLRWHHDVLEPLASALLHYSITSQTASQRQPRSSSLLRSDLVSSESFGQALAARPCHGYSYRAPAPLQDFPDLESQLMHALLLWMSP
ncbi:hypothetical protein CBOM_07739 [Ceraceosorus bombacis]|uniref:Uncharacterized protein n=1 Tax=Ceraceosorus bombacis TaxID=401625 RepID=A0A0P1BHQ8_9BASI|nr:hypothetical protein CBOM_07739 [Ceraceosorus bombacis]